MVPITPRTIINCKHRRHVERVNGTELAVCKLVQLMLGSTAADIGRVGRDACEACCAQFVPTATGPNPVVASLLYEAATEILARRGAAERDEAKARQVKAFSEEYLEAVVTSSVRQLVPARATCECVFQGQPIAEVGEDKEAQFKCHHPSHNVATLAGCRGCRDWQHVPTRGQLTARELIPVPHVRRGKPVRDWAVGVTTAPRAQPTLSWCLDSLMRAGWQSPHLFVDASADVPDRFRGVPMTWRDKRIGAWSNYYLALAELVATQPRADAYLLVQDDAFFYDREDLCDYLTEVLWPSDPPGLVSLYCSAAYTARDAGWHPLQGEWLWGALAFVFPNEIARQCLADPLVTSPSWNEPGCANIDSLIGRWANVRQIPIWYPSPSLVQHVGNTSTIWTAASNSGPRQADWFAGDCDMPFAVDSDLAAFPEHEFSVAASGDGEYRRRVATGYERMKNSSVVIAGLCRDAQRHLPRTIARIERLGELFAEYRVVLFENDSNDRSRQYLWEWSRENPRVTVLTERFGVPRFAQTRSLDRAERMAHYRNIYRRHIVDRCRDSHFVIVADTDLRGGWSYDGIANTFGHAEWDFVGSAGLMRLPYPTKDGGQQVVHFDAWAFRELGHPEPHDFKTVNQMSFRRGQPLRRVDSCFGGLGVYRAECVSEAKYGGEDCEHVVLHHEMRDRGFDRLYLNPSQLVVY